MNAAHLAQLAKLKSRFDGIARRVRSAVPQALEAQANDLAAEMKRLAPHRTGDLAASITVTPGNSATPADETGVTRIVPVGKVAITAGDSSVTYAKATEFGTSREHAEPFFVPAIRAGKASIKDGVARAVADSMGGKS